METKNIHRCYFSMKKNERTGEFAYLLFDENSKLIQKEKIKERIKPRNKERYIYQVLLYLLQVAKHLGIKNITIYSHHHEQKTILAKMSKGKTSYMIEKMQRTHPDFVQMMQQFDYFRYKRVQKETNKKAYIYFQEGIVCEETVAKETIFMQAYVDVSTYSEEKESYIAGIAKNKENETKLTYRQNVPFCNNTNKLEIMAIIEMMKQATEKNLHPIIIHTDNQVAYRYFNQFIEKEKECPELVQLTRDARNDYPNCLVRYIHRKHNKEAHRLARRTKTEQPSFT